MDGSSRAEVEWFCSQKDLGLHHRAVRTTCPSPICETVQSPLQSCCAARRSLWHVAGAQEGLLGALGDSWTRSLGSESHTRLRDEPGAWEVLAPGEARRQSRHTSLGLASARSPCSPHRESPGSLLASCRSDSASGATEARVSGTSPRSPSSLPSP